MRASRQDDLLKAESGTVGPPCAGTSAKVVDTATGAALPPGEEGELLIKGPQVMAGYLDLPEQTAACLSADGWLSTGDIAKLDEDGFVYITDRLKELIKYKGFQVAPAELEATLCTHPSVADATVIPVDDEEAGEVPRAYVVLKPGVGHQGLSESDLMAYVAQRVAPYKRLRGGVRYVESVPKTASGKILRRLVIEQDRAAEASSSSHQQIPEV